MHKTITARIRQNGILTIALLGVAIALSLLLLFSMAMLNSEILQKNKMRTNMLTLIGDTIPDNAWELVSGRMPMQNSTLVQDAAALQAEISAFGAIASPQVQSSIPIPRRVAASISEYVHLLVENLNRHAPYEENWLIVENLRLVCDELRTQISQLWIDEMTYVEQQNAISLSRIFYLTVVNIIVWGVALWYTIFTTRKLQQDIEHAHARMGEYLDELALGKLGVQPPELETDEYARLISAVHDMAGRLQNLMQHIRHEQQELKKSELRLLQAQINPHFLYNTLDAIVWLAEDDDSKNVIRITQSLSDFFRISLSSGDDWISLEKEIRHLQGYLSIQGIRYRDILTYEIRIDEAMKKHTILKLLLQPLVENALYHGIKNKRGGGKITVTGTMDGEMMCFSVHDTGHGFSPERLQEIRNMLANDARLDPSDHSSGFGLRNVNLRLRLYYGIESGLEIKSDSTGTTVFFSVPCEWTM